MIRELKLLVMIIPLAGCDGTMRIHGVAPEDEVCFIKLIERDTNRVGKIISVSGNFEEGVFFPGSWRRPKIDIVTECRGALVSIIENPRYPDVDLGNLWP
jgi:hypothetical protein